MSPAPVGWSGRAAARVDALVGPLCRWLTWASAGCLAFMAALTVADVLGRYFLNRPLPGALELSEFALVVIVYLALGTTGLTGRQVVVDLVVERFPPRQRAGSEAAGALLGIAFWTAIAWRTAAHAREIALKGEVSTILAVPAFPFVYAVALGGTLMALALFGRFLAALSRAAAR